MMREKFGYEKGFFFVSLLFSCLDFFISLLLVEF